MSKKLHKGCVTFEVPKCPPPKFPLVQAGDRISFNHIFDSTHNVHFDTDIIIYINSKPQLEKLRFNSRDDKYALQGPLKPLTCQNIAGFIAFMLGLAIEKQAHDIFSDKCQSWTFVKRTE